MLISFVRHLSILVILAIIYSIINISFVVTTGEEIYPGISWDNFISYIITLIGLIILTLTFLLGEFVYKRWKRELIEQKKVTLQKYNIFPI